MMIADFAQATDLSLICIDAEGNIQFVNPAASKLFGYEHDEMLGQPITLIIPKRMQGGHTAGLARVAAGEKPNLGGKAVEVSAVKKNGIEFPIEITLSVWREDGRVCAGAIIKDISERRERESRLYRLACQDTLTGLHNRHRFIEILRTELEAGHPLALILLDLDGFKDVNDTHGHIVGDSLLQAVSVRLPYLLGKTAEVARLGGDEFAILLPGVHEPGMALAQADAIIRAFEVPFNVGGQVLDLGVSLGFAVAPLHGTDGEELLAAADFALYRAKAAGRRTVKMFDTSMRQDSMANRIKRDRLRQGLKQGELVVHYQPQVALGSRMLIGAEALVRWQHPEEGLLLPGRFLPALETSVLALEMGWWILETACQQIETYCRAEKPLKIGVNLFPSQLWSPQICNRVSDLINRYQFNPELLELEVTETVTLHDEDKAFKVLSGLREIGVGIAFDDFGTGYASLSSLQRYPLTSLKIDRSFVRDLQAGSRGLAITRGLISMSNDLGLQTIVEGIETVEQQETMMALGCLYGQGFLYGKAAAADQLPNLPTTAVHTFVPEDFQKTLCALSS